MGHAGARGWELSHHRCSSPWKLYMVESKLADGRPVGWEYAPCFFLELLLFSSQCGGDLQGALWVAEHRYQCSRVGLQQHPGPPSPLPGRFFWQQPTRESRCNLQRKMAAVKHFRNSPPSFSVPGTKLEQLIYRAIVLLLTCTLSVS